jgi:hypothetical protein
MTEIEQVARLIDPEAFTKEAEIYAPARFGSIGRGNLLRAENELDDRRRAALAKAQDILNLIKPEGWRLVPVEPTEEMLQGADALKYGEPVEGYSVDLAAIYRAMIQAYPPPPVAP